MRVICPTCGERWDLDDLHAEVRARFRLGEPRSHSDRLRYREAFAIVAGEFNAVGCAALTSSEHDPTKGGSHD